MKKKIIIGYTVSLGHGLPGRKIANELHAAGSPLDPWPFSYDLRKCCVWFKREDAVAWIVKRYMCHPTILSINRVVRKTKSTSARRKSSC